LNVFPEHYPPVITVWGRTEHKNKLSYISTLQGGTKKKSQKRPPATYPDRSMKKADPPGDSSKRGWAKGLSQGWGSPRQVEGGREAE